jgi:hypothetical protein
MNDGQIHQISSELGALRAAVELMTDLWKTQEASATAGRKALHDKFENFKDAVGLQIAGLSLRVDRLTDQVTVIQPSVKGFNDDKLRAEGAKHLGKLLIAGMTAAAGMVGWGVHEFIGRFWPH